MRRIRVLVVLAGATIGLLAPGAAASKVPPPDPTCAVVGVAVPKRALVSSLTPGIKDKPTMVRITGTVDECTATGFGGVLPLTGALTGKLKLPSTVLADALTATNVPFKFVIKWTFGGQRFSATKGKAIAAAPFQPLAGPNDPAAGVVLHLDGITSKVFAGRSYSLTLATSMLAPSVYASGAPTVSSFDIGSFHGNDSSVVIGP